MKNIFLFHGYNGKKMSHWMLWLEKELKDKNIDVYFPEYKDSQNPVMENWLGEFETYISKINPETIFVAHSFGCLVAFKILQKLNIKISKVILVAPLKNKMTGLSLKGLWQRIGDKEREIVARFVEQELDWQNIKNKASNFIFCLSRDDHAVDFEESFKYYKELFPDADFKIYENYGHFNHKKNIYEMPDILSII